MDKILRCLHLKDNWGATVFGIFAGLVFAVTVIVGGIVVLAVNIDGRNCALLQEHTGRDTTYDLWSGCYIQKQDGTYVPSGSYSLVDNEEN